MLLDMRKITDKGPVETFSYSARYFNYESYVVFNQEAIQNVVLALITVFVVILCITGNIRITLFVLICVALVDLFLFALLAWWDVALNSVTIINIVIAIGLAVDYSAHIGHSYL